MDPQLKPMRLEERGRVCRLESVVLIVSHAVDDRGAFQHNEDQVDQWRGYGDRDVSTWRNVSSAGTREDHLLGRRHVFEHRQRRDDVELLVFVEVARGKPAPDEPGVRPNRGVWRVGIDPHVRTEMPSRAIERSIGASDVEHPRPVREVRRDRLNPEPLQHAIDARHRVRSPRKLNRKLVRMI